MEGQIEKYTAGSRIPRYYSKLRKLEERTFPNQSPIGGKFLNGAQMR